MTARRVPVRLGDRSYDVVVGTGLVDDVPACVPLPPHAVRAAVVTVPPVARYYADLVVAGFQPVVAVDVIEIPDGEDAKTLDTVAAVFRRFASMPLGRDDVVVALGGGVVGDLAGFAAATWHRGVAVIQVATTLLAQVDAAIGGKTGVNLPEGKNLVGAFHQPLGVVADTATLKTLPQRELRAGLGEVAKYGYIADPELLVLLSAHADDALAGDQALLAEIVRRCAAVKADFVAADEREGATRAYLNYGHTVGHAIEALTGYATYRHGEAVALGMVAAARLSERLGIATTGLADDTVSLLQRLQLPTGGLELDPEALWTALARDKKARAGVRFVLCERPGVVRMVEQPDRAVVDEVLRSLL